MNSDIISYYVVVITVMMGYLASSLFIINIYRNYWILLFIAFLGVLVSALLMRIIPFNFQLSMKDANDSDTQN